MLSPIRRWFFSNFLPEESLKRGKIEEPRWKDTLKQVMASCIVHCIVIQAGVNMAYSTVLIGGLERAAAIDNSTDHNDKVIMMNEDHASWIASLVTITLPIGSLMAGPLMDRFGRKKICILVCIPTCISWILLIFSNSLRMIYVGRCVAGASAGLTSVGLIYVIEITHPRVRPMLTCLNSVFVSLGILLTCLFASWLDWRQIAILFLALNLIIFFGLFAIPESPYWLACFNDRTCTEDRRLKMSRRVEKSLGWLNPTTLMYEQEYDRLRETIGRETTRRDRATETERPDEDKRWHLSVIESGKFYANQVSQPGVYKPLLLLLVVLLMQQLSGAYVIIFYAISVFREIGGGTFGNGQLDEYGALLLLGVIRFFMSILTAYLSRTVGRRILCIASGLGMSFAMFFSAMLVHLTSIVDTSATDHPLVSTLTQQKWLLLVVVLFYVCTSTLGFIVIPWTLIGELLPISFRGLGTSILISVAYLIMFAVVKTYPYALLILGPRNIFFFFSLMSVLGTSFIYLFLPETLGKSFKQIEDYFATEIRDKNEIADANKKA